MNKLALEILLDVLDDCSEKLDSSILSSEDKSVFLEASAVIADIVLDSVEDTSK